MEKYEELLVLAREAIRSQFNGKQIEVNKEIKRKYSQEGACFVTLTEGGDLRGCIGSLEARHSLYQDVIDNSINAAFNDPRFPELEEEELEGIRIEISVLTRPEKLGIGKEVFDEIDKDMGIILKKGFHSATFLPQVWEELPDKEVFLEQLSLKAGLFGDDWKTSELWFYRVEKIKEE